MKLDYKGLLENALKMNGTLSKCYSLFHNYSFNNMVLLWGQFEDREQEMCPVATYKKWQEMGRQVKKGSKAFTMYQPAFREIEDENGEKEVLTYFFPRNRWFAMRDTEGKEIKLETPKFSLNRILGNLGIKLIDFDHLNGNVQGFCRKGNIAINPVAENPIKTALHEIAHSLLHSQEEKIHDEKGIRECEAESTALLAGMALNVLDEKAKKNSVGYIKHWMSQYKDMDEGKLIERCAKNIFSAVDRILKANREEMKNA